jgi:hypothetical protein
MAILLRYDLAKYLFRQTSTVVGSFVFPSRPHRTAAQPHNMTSTFTYDNDRDLGHWPWTMASAAAALITVLINQPTQH